MSSIEYENQGFISNNPVVGLDQQGEVIYANYYKNDFSLSAYFEDAIKWYEKTYIDHSYGIQLIHNEIYDPFCSNDCYRDS